MKKLIVFVRHNNDLDHITPILYKWLETKNIAIHIIITSNEKLYYDYRLKFLRKNYGMKVIWGDGKEVRQLRISYIDDFFHGSFWKWFNAFYAKNPSIEKYKFVRKWISSNAHHLFKRIYDKNDRLVVCFDWTFNYFVNVFVSFCHAYGIPVVALPHGDEPYVNKIQKDDDTNYWDSIQPYRQRGIFDYILVPNKLCSDHYECLPGNYLNRVKTFGSPRYCKEWIPIHDSIRQGTLEDFKVKIMGRGSPPLKIVLFLRNSHWPLNYDEIKVLVKMISKTKSMLIVKGHARGRQIDPFQFIMPDGNIFVDTSNALNPSYLIDWADLILDVGTSTTWEAIVKNKPILMLDYVCGNKPTISKYMPKTKITCRDDLCEQLRMFCNNPTRKIYKQEQRIKFMKDIIGSGNILQKYVNFLEGQYEN